MQDEKIFRIFILITLIGFSLSVGCADRIDQNGNITLQNEKSEVNEIPLDTPVGKLFLNNNYLYNITFRVINGEPISKHEVEIAVHGTPSNTFSCEEIEYHYSIPYLAPLGEDVFIIHTYQRSNKCQYRYTFDISALVQ